jgi:hypothetical protein
MLTEPRYRWSGPCPPLKAAPVRWAGFNQQPVQTSALDRQDRPSSVNQECVGKRPANPHQLWAIKPRRASPASLGQPCPCLDPTHARSSDGGRSGRPIGTCRYRADAKDAPAALESILVGSRVSRSAASWTHFPIRDGRERAAVRKAIEPQAGGHHGPEKETGCKAAVRKSS